MRRGLGHGQGSGYKNILMQDSLIHRQSSLGIKQPQQIYQGTYRRQIINPETGIRQIKALPLGKVHYNGKFVKFNLGDRTICYKLKFNHSVGNIANWGHSMTDNRLFIDKDVPDRYKPQLAVHEAVEQFVSESYGFKYREAHDIAEHFERKYADQHGIDWQTSQKAIFETPL